MKLSSEDYDPKDIFKFIREWTGLTQEEFGELIGKKGRSWARNIEYGSARFYFDDLYEICNKYNIRIVFEKTKTNNKITQKN